MTRRCVALGVPALAGLILVGSVLSPRTAVGTTWHVPGDAPTIQAGIDLAQPGDDVLVAAGVYPEHDIVMKGGIRVHSEQGPGVTTIDAQSGGRVFSCSDFQDEATIEGFTLLNGRTADDGGGLRCIRAALLIRDCVITGCFTQAEGGGVYAEDSSLQIEGCEIGSNRGENAGGGVACTRSTLLIHDSRITDCFTWGCGGGVAGLDSSIDLTDSEIVGNRGWCGGGVSSIRAVQLTAERCTILSNRGLCVGGGIACSGSFDIVDCLIARNRSVECGQGWAFSLSGVGRIAGCTVAGNWGAYEFVMDLYDVDLSIERTIVAFHDGGDAIGCPAPGVTVRCCDIYGNGSDEICGEDLGGNFSADPLFCDVENGDYTLDAHSPCLPGNHPDGVDCGLIGVRGRGCGTLPTGACCFADGSCVVVEQQQCEEQHGTYQGDGSGCEPNSCPPTSVEITTWGRIKHGYR